MSAQYAQNTAQTMNEPLVLDKGYRIIQIHPTLKCNLTCLHCYSGSAPQFKEELPLESLKKFLREAWEDGYNAISLSGGEPFVYSGIHELLAYSKSIGYLNSVTTNGMLFKGRPKNIAALKNVDLLAISLDGEPEHHNFMRNSPKAFEQMEQGIEVVKDQMDSYGFIHTVTPKTFNSLLWMADYIAHHQGKLFQLHPIENIGRGQAVYESLALGQDTLHRVHILFHYLQKKYEGQMVMELDLLHRDHILESPKSIYAQVNASDSLRITDHLRELIVTETGDLVPISHGFAPFFRVGNMLHGGAFRAQSESFMQHTFPVLQTLFDETFDAIKANEAVELLNWAELIVEHSQRYTAQ